MAAGGFLKKCSRAKGQKHGNEKTEAGNHLEGVGGPGIRQMCSDAFPLFSYHPLQFLGLAHLRLKTAPGDLWRGISCLGNACMHSRHRKCMLCSRCQHLHKTNHENVSKDVSSKETDCFGALACMHFCPLGQGWECGGGKGCGPHWWI